MKAGDKVWLVKYALTVGIKEEEVNHIYDTKYCRMRRLMYGLFVIGRDVFPTKQEAVNKANEMRDKKIKSLEKQIDKLKKLTF